MKTSPLARTTYKQQAPKNARLSVSSERETHRAPKSRAKCFRELELWVDLSNWSLEPERTAEFIRRIKTLPETPTFPRAQLLSLIEGYAKDPESQDPKGEGAELGTLIGELSYVVDSVASHLGSDRILVSTTYALTYENEAVRLEPVRTPFANFAKAINEIGDAKDRIRQCPVCQSYYFAARLTKPACSQRCGRTVRTRRHRERQDVYQQNRKLNQHRRLSLVRTGKRAVSLQETHLRLTRPKAQ
jgi:hypothetical protein